MQNFWSIFAHVAARIGGSARLLIAAFGFAFVMVAFGCGLDLSSTMLSDALATSGLPSAYLLADIGEIAGFVLIAIMLRKRLAICSKPPLLISGYTAFAVGLLMFAVGNVRGEILPIALGATAAVLIGIGYAIALLAWLEYVSCLQPKEMVIIIAGMYFFYSLGMLSLLAVATVVVCILSVAIVMLSFLAFTCLYATTDDGDKPSSIPAHQYLPTSIIFWIAIFTFAYGIGSQLSSLDFTSWAMKVGYALPAIIIMVGFLALKDRFDLYSLYYIVLSTMMVGLLVAVFMESYPHLSKIMISAAHSSMYLLVYTIFCSAAKRRKASPAFGCAIVMIVGITMVQLGKVTSQTLQNIGGTLLLIIVVVVLIAISGAFFFHNNTAAVYLQLDDGTGDLDQNRYAALGQERGLSTREMTVYLLLVQGKSAAQISDELFIAPSTVRAHISRIYDKFGAHSRQEFSNIVFEKINARKRIRES